MAIDFRSVLTEKRHEAKISPEGRKIIDILRQQMKDVGKLKYTSTVQAGNLIT